MLKEAVRLFVEEAAKMGTLDQILEESQFVRISHDGGEEWQAPRIVASEVMDLEIGG